MDDLDHAALGCGRAPAPRRDVQQFLIFRSWVRPQWGHAGKYAIGFGHAAPKRLKLSNWSHSGGLQTVLSVQLTSYRRGYSLLKNLV